MTLQTILKSSFKKIPQACSNYPSLKVLEAHIGENTQNTLKINPIQGGSKKMRNFLGKPPF